MPDETPGAKLPSPWKDFLGDIDKALEKPLEIHCIGGFALVCGKRSRVNYVLTRFNGNLQELSQCEGIVGRA